MRKKQVPIKIYNDDRTALYIIQAKMEIIESKKLNQADVIRKMIEIVHKELGE
jgi:hypothetical protein